MYLQQLVPSAVSIMALYYSRTITINSRVYRNRAHSKVRNEDKRLKIKEGAKSAQGRGQNQEASVHLASDQPKKGAKSVQVKDVFSLQRPKQGQHLTFFHLVLRLLFFV